MICKCGKCGGQFEIVCLVDDVPYCERCLLAALGPLPSGLDDDSSRLTEEARAET